MNAWALLVVSSDQQAETLAHQRTWAEETAVAQGWKLDKMFSGVSTGKAGPRRLLRELIGALRELAPDERPAWVLMIRADRVGRGRIDASLVALHEIVDLGVRIWTRDAGELKLDSATDQIIAAVKAGLATLENEVRRDKALGVYHRKLADGTWTGSKRPYGLTYGRDGDVVVEEQAVVIRLIFQWRIEGLGYLTIAKRVAPIAPPVNGRPIHWTTRRVRELLQNGAFVGTIVDEVTFHRAQAVAAAIARVELRGPKVRKYPMPLIGTLKCWCGYRLARKISGPAGTYRSYACVATWNHGGRMVFASAKRVEAQFVAMLHRLTTEPTLIAAERGPSPAMIEQAIRKTDAEIAEVDAARSRAWDLHAAGKIRDEDVQERLDALRAQREVLDTQRADLARQRAALTATRVRRIDAVAVIATAAREFGRSSPESQAKLAASVAVALGGLYLDDTKTLRYGPVAMIGRIGRRSAR